MAAEYDNSPAIVKTQVQVFADVLPGLPGI
jgi:hypothetical protein